MDVKTAFLHGDLEEIVYMEKLKAFAKEGLGGSFEEIIVWLETKPKAMVS